MDLKRDGLLPLVSAARVLALCAGSGARGTPQRLRAAAAGGRLPEGDADALVDLHADLVQAILEQQLADLDAGVRPSGRVVLGSLPRARRARIRDGLGRLDAVVGELRGAVAR